MTLGSVTFLELI